ncbi:MAG: FAD-binding protein, partial [Burkholderiales bacterium]
KKADELGRDFSKKPTIKAPYRMSKIIGALSHTQGGLEIDTSCRVLRTDGTPFPNLFAGGGAARGLSGPADWGYMSGSGLLMATTTGRLAGEAAAALVQKR